MPLTRDEAFQRYLDELPHIEAAVEATRAHVYRCATREGISCEVTARAKDASSFRKKISLKGYTDPWGEITDKAGIRVVVPHRGLLDPALKVIRECLEVKDEKDQRDAIDAENRLRYPRLHVQTFMVGGEVDPDGKRYECEIQLWTEAVDLWSRMSHKLLYKPAVAPQPMSDARCTV